MHQDHDRLAQALALRQQRARLLVQIPHRALAAGSGVALRWAAFWDTCLVAVATATLSTTRMLIASINDTSPTTAAPGQEAGLAVAVRLTVHRRSLRRRLPLHRAAVVPALPLALVEQRDAESVFDFSGKSTSRQLDLDFGCALHLLYLSGTVL